jgi:hypothetical protein
MTKNSIKLLLLICLLILSCNSNPTVENKQSLPKCYGFNDTHKVWGCANSVIYIKIDSLNFVRLETDFTKIPLGYCTQLKPENCKISLDTYKIGLVLKPYCADVYAVNHEIPTESVASQSYTIFVTRYKVEDEVYIDMQINNLEFITQKLIINKVECSKINISNYPG